MKNKIIHLIKYNKDRIIICFNDKTNLKLNKNVITTYPLFVGKIISGDFLIELEEFSKIEDLLLIVKKKVNFDNCTIDKITTLLKKNGGSKKQIKQVIKRLQESNLLDETLILESVLEKADYKHYGYNWIIDKLSKLKLSSDMINKVKYNTTREIKEAKLYLNSIKTKYDHKNNYQRKKSIFNSLLRSGFSFEVSSEIIDKISNSNEYHELNVLKLDYIKALGKYRAKYSKDELDKKVVNYLLSKGYELNDIKYVEELNKWNG